MKLKIPKQTNKNRKVVIFFTNKTRDKFIKSIDKKSKTNYNIRTIINMR